MEFKKYSSLENHYRQPFIDKCEAALPAGLNTLCQVTEKIHGANFGIYVNDEGIKLAKRKSFCGEDFFGCGDVTRHLEGKIKALHDYLQGEVIVYGEFAGKGVQSGIDYGNKAFYAYDITRNGVYLSTDEVFNFCAYYDIPHVPVIKSEITMRDALLMNETFKSKVIDVEGDNYAEGFVIKPIQPAYLMNGSRIAIKQVSTKFEEVSNNKVKVKKPVKPLCKIDGDIVNDVSLYITQNRLTHVLSHEGIPTHKEFGKIAGLLLQDARDDFEKERGIKIKDIAQEYTRVNKELMKYTTTIVRGDNGENWVKICAGEL